MVCGLAELFKRMSSSRVLSGNEASIPVFPTKAGCVFNMLFITIIPFSVGLARSMSVGDPLLTVVFVLVTVKEGEESNKRSHRTQSCRGSRVTQR